MIVMFILLVIAVFLWIGASVTAKNEKDKVKKMEELLRINKGIENVGDTITNSQNKLNELHIKLKEIEQQTMQEDVTVEYLEYSLYKKKYDFVDSKKYKQLLDNMDDKQKMLVKNNRAITQQNPYPSDSLSAYIKLLIRAYVNEVDLIISKVKAGGIKITQDRIEKCYEKLNKISDPLKISISKAYHQLKIEELEIYYEYLEKLQEEKEEQRRINEQMREEAKRQREVEKAQKEAEKEYNIRLKALEEAEAKYEHASKAEKIKYAQELEELKIKLKEAEEKNKKAISQAQLTKAGHVYVISNIGSFGENLFKIGMTRRLEPQERIDELGDASVPFPFDVHAMIYSEDAPTLENELHKVFDERRVNKVNFRKEFFRVTIEDIEREVIKRNADILITKLAEAAQYKISIRKA